MKVLLAIDGSPCSLAAVKEVGSRHWPEGTVVRLFAAVTTWFPSIPDPLLIGAAMYRDLIETERKRLNKLVESTAAELRKQLARTFELRPRSLMVHRKKSSWRKPRNGGLI